MSEPAQILKQKQIATLRARLEEEKRQATHREFETILKKYGITQNKISKMTAKPTTLQNQNQLAKPKELRIATGTMEEKKDVAHGNGMDVMTALQSLKSKIEEEQKKRESLALQNKIKELPEEKRRLLQYDSLVQIKLPQPPNNASEDIKKVYRIFNNRMGTVKSVFLNQKGSLSVLIHAIFYGNEERLPDRSFGVQFLYAPPAKKGGLRKTRRRCS